MSVFLQPLQTVTVGSGGAASIVLSSIPQTYTDLIVKISARSDGNDGIQWKTLAFFLNGDSSALYNYTYVLGNGSATFTASGTNANNGESWIAGNTNTSNVFSNTEYYIPNYTSSNFKCLTVDSTAENNGTTSLIMYTSNLYKSTNPITSITLAPGGGSNFVQYSTVSLYGVLCQGI